MCGYIDIVLYEDFYPRPPRGGRRKRASASPTCATFLSTPSVRRATRLRLLHPAHQPISIHALREEGDWFWFCCEWRRRHFYLHPPRGGRRGGVQPDRRPRRISIHALREEGDCQRKQGGDHTDDISIHALREEGDMLLLTYVFISEISIHALRGEGDLSP